MPSDLSIAKLKGTTAPVTPVTREERSVSAHQKANSLAKTYPNVYSKEELPDVLETLGVYSLTERMVRSDMWDPKTRAVASNTAVRNLAASVVGFPADTLKLMYEGWRNTPGGMTAPSSEDSLLDAFTSERLASQFGGDPEHVSFLPAQLLAPGPGEFKGIMAFGRKAAQNLGEIARLDEAIKMGVEKADPFNTDIARKTGWYKGQDGELKFLVDDSNATFPWVDRVKESAAKNIKQMEELGVDAMYGDFMGLLEDVIDMPELFKAYPELRNLPVQIRYKVDKAGDIMVTHPNAGLGLGSLADNKAGEMFGLRIIHETGDHPWRNTLMHEIQHAVQNIEGFARGGTPRVNEAAAKTLAQAWDQREAIGIIDSQADSIDELAAVLQQQGWAEDRIDDVIRNKEVQAYLGAGWDQDEFTKHGIRSSIEGTLSMAADEINYVLTYLDPEDVEEAMETIATQMGDNKGRMLPYLFSRSYGNLMGEAEARVSGNTAGMRLKEALDKGVFDYRKSLDDFKEGMGAGEMHPRATNPRVVGLDESHGIGVE